MNSPSLLRIGKLALLVPLAIVLVACGDSACEELGSEVCPFCADATYRESCEQLVEEEIEDVCATQKSTFQRACPPPP